LLQWHSQPVRVRPVSGGSERDLNEHGLSACCLSATLAIGNITVIPMRRKPLVGGALAVRGKWLRGRAAGEFAQDFRLELMDSSPRNRPRVLKEDAERHWMHGRRTGAIFAYMARAPEGLARLRKRIVVAIAMSL